MISLGASAALGVAALVVARVWLPNHGAPHAAQAAPMVVDGVPVVTAATGIAYGTKLEARQLTLTRLPRNAVPAGAYSSIAQVMALDNGGAPVALVPITAREPVLMTKLSGPGARATMAALIQPGMRAYTIGVTEVAGGGGHVMPGDRVDVVLTREFGQPGPDGANNGKRYVTDVVLQDARVLGMDLNADPTSTRPVAPRTATLEVTVRNAEKLALAAQAGTMTLALRRLGSAEIDPTAPVTNGDLGPAATSVGRPIRAAGAPAASHSRAAPAAAPGSSVLVIQGDKSTSVSVPAERAGA